MTLLQRAQAWIGEGDSFTRMSVRASGQGVEVDYGPYGTVKVSSMKALRESLPERQGVNTQGLLSGEVLTPLGRMRFTVRACPEHEQPHQAGISLEGDGVSVGNVTYDRLYVTNYTERSSVLNFGGWSVRGQTHTHSWDWSRALSTQASRATHWVRQMLVTPAFYHALDTEVQKGVVAKAEKAVSEAERYFAQAQALLASLEDCHEHEHAV